MKKLILVFFVFCVYNSTNAQQISKIKKNNLKIITEKEQLPSNESAFKIIWKMYGYEEKFGEFSKSELKDSVVYEYNNYGQIINFRDYDMGVKFDENDKAIHTRNLAISIQYKYDKNNLLFEEFDSIKNYPIAKYKSDNSGKVIIKNSYNSYGDEIYKTTFQYDAMGRIIKKYVDRIPYSCTYTYDIKNNISEEKSSPLPNIKTVSTSKYLLENVIELKIIVYNSNGQVVYRNNGGYKHFVFENKNNKNNNWINRVTYSVTDQNLSNKKRTELTERIFSNY